jgi:Subtilase family
VTGPGSWRNHLAPWVADEVEYVIRSFAEHGTEIGFVRAGRGVGYLYAAGRLLVREEYLGRVQAILRSTRAGRAPDGAGPPPPETGPPPDRAGPPPPETAPDRDAADRDEDDQVEHVIRGVVLLTLRPGQLAVPEALDEIDRRLGRGIATPDHVLTVANGSPGPDGPAGSAGSDGEGGICPATEPQEAYDRIEPFPSVCPGSGGAGVLIYMADTGLLASAASHAWLAGVEAGNVDPLPPLDANGTQPIPPYTGHGTFVAGVARCMAPAADIIMTNAFAIAGSTLESHLVRRLGAALGLGVDIFHLTIAALTREDLPLLSFEAWLGLLRQYKGVVCVVAAGNNNSRRPCWPAAFAEVVSVGALAGDWRSRASFSNFGGWVDVYAPGRSLVNAYATGTYTCHVAPYKGEKRKFYGMAQWSGTSFSTPVVTGLIAARMSRTGESGQEAAAALLAQGRAQAIPGLGAVLLPCCDHDVRPGAPECRPAGRPRDCGCG